LLGQIHPRGGLCRSAPNYTAQCLAVQQAGANAIYVVDGATICASGG
jgi:hypothetical protein